MKRLSILYMQRLRLSNNLPRNRIERNGPGNYSDPYRWTIRKYPDKMALDPAKFLLQLVFKKRESE